MEQEHIHHYPSIWEKNKMLIKGLFIGFLIVVMLIPVAMMTGLINEREQRQNEVATEISSKWANAQNIAGPIILIPYNVRLDQSKPAVRKYIYLLPENLNINGKIFPEVRHRSLYDVTLYKSDLSVSGNFDPACISKFGIPAENILWSECKILFGLSDARGLEENVSLQLDTAHYTLESGLPENNVLQQGLSTTISLNGQKTTPFFINLKLKGSSYLYFTPVGNTTQVQLTSAWKDPAFDGQYLPSTPVKISDGGFSAQWKILQVSRSYPQTWINDVNYSIEKSSFGVKLLQPTDGYAKTQRSVKYAMLIIALTFTIFFFLEIFQKKQVHPLQYILVGIALAVFYTLLLSISEYTGFNVAYAIASIATVLLISIYISGIFKKRQIAGGFAAALSALYAYIFILIQLQDYALLYGSIGLFVILAIIMHFSKRVNWYATNQSENK